MAEEKNPTITIDDLKKNLASYIHKKYSDVLTDGDIFDAVDRALVLLKRSETDLLDKFLVNWRGGDIFIALMGKFVTEGKRQIDHFAFVVEAWNDRAQIFGEELTRAAKEAQENGEYNKWYFGVRYGMYRRGTWPISG